ncbi:TetR family transcriptional regulator [Nocardia terpenica]|uniref:TetR family transcriptional regulator n=1 Tax=Nocardia terpenica TaxID=455432 RepID=UPI001893F9F2|nr:TetR family transcriptional regulator [Nocardia terpenica]MBF6061330.1 TetR family transcriptional regulator [Nocardia terpenica]MBF6105441.1 TetR family transcriptional regulator [Nocardia terpenica]MBF6113089.1 TetR family transcriptional regulator [Nocardia terpenica]MBF6119219.1 TetR family transcriptional regulator [Nocardia terpenica]MBF6152867.1 TetR family transcriptional regulator [Nocardia terpenica]
MPSKPRRSPRPQERQRDPERTRRLILDAATAEFGAHGFAGARISAIAARAGVNQQLISYYFDGKEGLYQAMSQQWRERQRHLIPPGTPFPEQMRRYVMEALHNPDGVRLLAWGGLEYTRPTDDPDHAPRTRMLAESVEELRAAQAEGRLPADIDPACLLVMLMAAAMAPTTLPQVIDGLTGADSHSPDFLHHFADQMVIVARHLGLR